MQTFTNVIVNKTCSDKRFTSLATGCVQTFTNVIVNKMCYDKRFLQKVPIVDDIDVQKTSVLRGAFQKVLEGSQWFPMLSTTTGHMGHKGHKGHMGHKGRLRAHLFMILLDFQHFSLFSRIFLL